MSDHIIIFDTTLRDGEQSPGASMTLEEKVRIAKSLELLGVDVIEAGFAIASEGDFKAVQAVARTIKNSRICSLSRASEMDITRAAEAIEAAPLKRIHTFIGTSPVHLKYKLEMTEDQVYEKAIAAVAFARNLCDDVEFSPEDAGRSELDFLCRIIEGAINAGATTINIPDTVGYTVPEQYGQMIATLIERIPNSDKVIFSTHCHNDLGMAVANSLSAVTNGARQIECTINGLGERAGNTALEEVVMALKTRKDHFLADTRLNTKQLVSCSKLVSSITGFTVQPNKAIVGANAFAHEAGIHQAGVLKNPETYEIMKAEDVGWSTNRIVLGKHSGRNALLDRLKKLDIHLDKAETESVFTRFKALADIKHEVYDDDLHALVNDSHAALDQAALQLVSLTASLDPDNLPVASLILNFNGQECTATAQGDGLVDAAFKALESVVNSETQLLLYSVNNVTDGTDSVGEVTVRLESTGRVVNGQGSHTDIVTASVKAYINALNRMWFMSDKTHPQQSTP